FIFYRDLNEPLVTIDDLRADYNNLRADYNNLRADYNNLRADYERLLQNASPLLELSQNTTFKIYRKAYQKSLPLLRTVRRWVKK
ncbi:fucosyltransferase, partial [Helicobacter pylori]|nr:fucosyltransferase [Helicobacter pylori]